MHKFAYTSTCMTTVPGIVLLIKTKGDKMDISDEAVEAAAIRLRESRLNGRAGLDWCQLEGKYQDEFRKSARDVLEAAAPHLMAPVLELADELSGSRLACSGYMSGRGSGFRLASQRIRQVLGLAK